MVIVAAEAVDVQRDARGRGGHPPGVARARAHGGDVRLDPVRGERAGELQRSTLRAIVALSKIAPSGASVRFDALVDSTRKSAEWGAEFQELVGV